MHDTDGQQAASVVTIDVGNLMAFDPRPIDTSQLKSDSNFLLNMTKVGTQLLLGELFNLPVERVEDVIVAKLPKGTTVLPREKPLPKQKPPTKWEMYAKLKGIQKKKKSRMVYDETTKEWRPTWGYNRKDDTTQDWIYEIKKNEDPYQDFFVKKTEARNERRAKNELQRLRNVARTSGKKGQVPGVGLQPLFTEQKNPDQLQVRNSLFEKKKLISIEGQTFFFKNID
jgi:regulator of ribosome biosynthesis